ncbi:hypothetical protein LG432_004658, partial [Salmonella enterica]|nr:hypothetical protein [Salmonella enterica]
GNGGGRVLISGDKGVTLNAAAGTVTLNAAKAATNGVNITSGNGAVSITNLVQDGSNGMTLTNANISSKDGIVLNGTTFWGQAVVMSGVNLTTGGDVDITGLAKNLTTGGLGVASSSGVQLSGSNISSTGGNITLTGTAGTHVSHPSISSLQVSNSTLTTNNALTLNGTTETTTGVKVTGSTLSAATLNVNGVARVQGTGFSLATSQLLGGLADLTNVSLSSAGSAAGAQNVLDNSIVNDANRDTLLAKRIENMTSVEMNGTAIFDDSAKSDKGWTQDYTLADLPNHGWVFNNTSVTAGGDVSLKGAGFTNSVVTITNGNLSIDNGGPAPLTGTTLTVDGGVNVHAGAGSIDLKNGNISAKGNITLKADAGSIAISGTNASVKANITSTEGGVNLVSMQAINITNANFLADKDISLNVASEVMGTLGIGNASFTSQSGDVDLFLDTKKITPIIITTDSQYGGLIFSGENSFEAKNINISALSSKDARGFSLLFESGAILNLKGETHINASNESDGTGRNDAALGSRYRRTQINVSDGDLYITASALSGTGIFGLVTAGQWADAGFEFVLNNSDLYIDANSKFGNGITLGCYGGSTYINGLTFKGNGNVSVHAQGGGYGITLSRLYTGELDGNVQLTGIGGNGAGIDASINTVFQGGVSLSGSSADDVGVSLSFGPGIQEHNMNLNGSNVTGSSENGSAGILIEGKNISFTNGTLTGTATSGNGSGVVLTGGSNYTLDG